MSAETDLQAGISAALFLLEDVRAFAEDAVVYLYDEGAALGAVPNDAQPAPTNYVKNLHDAIYALQSFGPQSILNFVPALGRAMGYAELDDATILARYFEHAGTTPITVKSRQMTFGSPAQSMVSTTGKGVVVRLTTDRYGFPIENVAAEAKTWTCIQDEHSGGRRWGESFSMRGTPVAQTKFPYQSAGLVVPVTCLSIADSQQYGVQNPGFETYDSVNGFTGWTAVTSMANFTQSTAHYYKDVLPQTNPASCVIAAGTDALYQTWSGGGIKWDPTRPLYAQIAYRRLGSATGTLYLQIGGITVSVDISTKTNGEWNILRWPVDVGTAVSKNAWFLNWNAQNSAVAPQTNPFIKIGVTSLAVGTIEIDDFICAPYTNVGGSWCAVVPGPTNSATNPAAAVPFLKDDAFTATDSSGAAAINQEWFARALNYYLPSTTGTPTWAEPSRPPS